MQAILRSCVTESYNSIPLKGLHLAKVRIEVLQMCKDIVPDLRQLELLCVEEKYVARHGMLASDTGPFMTLLQITYYFFNRLAMLVNRRYKLGTCIEGEHLKACTYATIQLHSLACSSTLLCS